MSSVFESIGGKKVVKIKFLSGVSKHDKKLLASYSILLRQYLVSGTSLQVHNIRITAWHKEITKGGGVVHPLF